MLVLARDIAGFGDCFEDDVDCFVVGAERGSKPAFVAHVGVVLFPVQDLLELRIDLAAPAQGVAKGWGARRHDHELLQVGAVFGVLATVEDVHHRHRQRSGAHSAEVAIEWQADGHGCSPRNSQRDAKNGIGAILALVGGGIELTHELVDAYLVESVPARQLEGQRLVDVLDRGEHALAAVALLVAVAQLHRLVHSGRRTGRNSRAANRSPGQQDLNLYRRVAPRVEDLSRDDGVDQRGHGLILLLTAFETLRP